MSVFWVLLGIAVLCGVAVVAAGRGDGLSPADRDRPDLALPDDRLLVRDDVDRLRFSVGLRGYRMDEVDDVLDRLAADIAARDAYIVELQGGAAPEADHGPAQGAALVPPVDTEQDLPTSRTLLVPLDHYVPVEEVPVEEVPVEEVPVEEVPVEEVPAEGTAEDRTAEVPAGEKLEAAAEPEARA